MRYSYNDHINYIHRYIYGFSNLIENINYSNLKKVFYTLSILIYDDQKFFSSISYSSSKAGLIGMTRWLGTKFATEKTTFNMISPAGVFNKHKKKFLKDYTSLIPQKKMASEKQIFSAIEFLISKNSDYVIGQNIFVDGGFSAW